MEKEQADALIGQLTADAVVRDALLIALIEEIPAIHGAIEGKVAVAAPVASSALRPEQRDYFQDRLRDVLALMRNA